MLNIRRYTLYLLLFILGMLISVTRLGVGRFDFERPY
jgi:hypothetical protein